VNWGRHKIFPDTERNNLRHALQSCVYRLQIRNLEIIAADIDTQLSQPDLDEMQLDELLIQKKNNDAIRREAAKYLGTVITRNV
jgi:hypothetical protein